MKIGSHIGISKGFNKVIDTCERINANAFQIFTHSPRSWSIKEANESDIIKFKEKSKNTIPYENMLVHAGYLINLASPKDDVWEKSIDLMIKELKITSKLGIKHYNVHPGSHLGKGYEFGIQRISKALNIILKETDESIMILLENVAQKGGNIGYKINQISDIINLTNYKNRIGLTYDTCHGFDSGYDITNINGIENLILEIKNNLGIDKLKMIHLNDSKYKLGENKDRHELIGKGNIGEKGFKLFLSYKEFNQLPLLLETPATDEEHAIEFEYIRNLVKK